MEHNLEVIADRLGNYKTFLFGEDIINIYIYIYMMKYFNSQGTQRIYKYKIVIPYCRDRNLST